MRDREISHDPGCFARPPLMHSDPRLIRILTVDDHALLRKGIAALVNAEPDMKLVAEASNGRDALESFRLHRPDVTLMDIQMPGFNGIGAIEYFLRTSH